MEIAAFYAEAVKAIAITWPWFWPCVAAMLGAVSGSFLNCARYRIPHKVSLRQPPSHCPQCKTVLRIPDLVPILSFVVLRGRCRYCGSTIGPASLVIEVTCALSAGALGWGVQALLMA